MNQRASLSKKQLNQDSQNTIETLKDFGTSVVKNSARDIKRIGTGMLDQFFGFNDYKDDFEGFDYQPRRESKIQRQPKQEFKVFNYQEYYERQKIKEEIKQLTELIKKEVEMLKKTDESFLNKVNDIQKLTVETLPEKPGIYHVRFLEIILSILKTIRMKVSESCTWLEAMKTKKKKRGSLFATLSKKKGTQYSLSTEIQTARSVQ